MNKTVKYLLLPLALLAVACAKDNSLSSGEKARLQLTSWIEHYHKGLQLDASGLYILPEADNDPGAGKSWSADSAYTYAEVTIRSLDGTVSSTTDEQWARQLGTYAIGNYYGPRFMQTGEGISYAGVDKMLEQLKIGGSLTAIVPAWYLTTSRYDTEQAYIDACSSTSHAIYTLRLRGQTNDIVRTEADSLRSYVTRHYGALQQSTTYADDQEADGSFYFVSDSSAFRTATPVSRDTTLHINYTGRLLNGQVFDTTDERTAKDAGIYDASKTYEPASIYFSSIVSSIKLDGNSVIGGFQGGLHLMRWKGQKAVALFTSAHGYTSSGSGNSIPPYSPLLFELELVKD